MTDKCCEAVSFDPAKLDQLRPMITPRGRLDHVLFASFEGQLAGRLADIERAVGAADWSEFQAICHKWRASAGSLGALRLAQLLGEAENAGKQCAAQQCANLASHIAQESRAVVTVIACHLGN